MLEPQGAGAGGRGPDPGDHLSRLPVGGGQFRAAARRERSKEAITLNISTPNIILEGISRIESWSTDRAREWVASTREYLRTPDRSRPLTHGVFLSSDQRSLLGDGRGAECDLETLCGRSTLSDFEALPHPLGLRGRSAWCAASIPRPRGPCPNDDEGLAYIASRGLRISVERRDFLNGVALGVTGADALSRGSCWASPLNDDPYPPGLTGMRGSHTAPRRSRTRCATQVVRPARRPTSGSPSTSWSSAAGMIRPVGGRILPEEEGPGRENPDPRQPRRLRRARPAREFSVGAGL